jgi:hypothetical protein
MPLSSILLILAPIGISTDIAISTVMISITVLRYLRSVVSAESRLTTKHTEDISVTMLDSWV